MEKYSVSQNIKFTGIPSFQNGFHCSLIKGLDDESITFENPINVSSITCQGDSIIVNKDLKITSLSLNDKVIINHKYFIIDNIKSNNDILNINSNVSLNGVIKNKNNQIMCDSNLTVNGLLTCDQLLIRNQKNDNLIFTKKVFFEDEVIITGPMKICNTFFQINDILPTENHDTVTVHSNLECKKIIANNYVSLGSGESLLSDCGIKSLKTNGLTIESNNDEVIISNTIIHKQLKSLSQNLRIIDDDRDYTLFKINHYSFSDSFIGPVNVKPNTWYEYETKEHNDKHVNSTTSGISTTHNLYLMRLRFVIDMNKLKTLNVNKVILRAINNDEVYSNYVYKVQNYYSENDIAYFEQTKMTPEKFVVTNVLFFNEGVKDFIIQILYDCEVDVEDSPEINYTLLFI
jgi:hypothetical protein